MKEILIRNFSKLNLNKIKEDFILSPIPSRPSVDANRMVQSYHAVLTEIMDKHCPIKKKTFKPRRSSVWYTNDLRELKRKRRRLERQLKKDNTFENKERYRQVKCNYNWELKKARIVYYKRCIGENKKNENSLIES